MSDQPNATPTKQTEWGGVRRKAVRGFAWWAATYPLLKILQIGASVVLAKLLSPTAFGVVAIASAALRGVLMFSELGVGSALIQSRRTDEAFINTAWTMQVLRGVGVLAVAAILAVPMSRWYDAPILLYMMPVIGVGALIDAARSTKYALLRRDLQERPRALLAMGESLLTRAVMIGLALVWPTPWCLVAGTLSGIVLVTGVSHGFPGTRNRLRWDGQAARELMRFGSWVFVGTVLAFVGSQLDALILGQLVASSIGALGVVGVYELAQRVARLPVEAHDVIGSQIAFPVLSEVARHDPTRYQERLLQVRSVLLPIGSMLCLSVVVLAPWFFDLLYDDRYTAARWLAPLMTASVWVALLNSSANGALLSLGMTRALATSSGVGAAGAVLGAIVGYGCVGIPGFVLGLAVGRTCEHAVDVWNLRKAGVDILRQDLRYTLWFALCAGTCWSAYAAGRGLREPMLKIGLGLVLPLLILAVLGLRTARRTIRLARSQ